MDWTPGSHASTFGGNPVSCAAALAVLDVIKDEQLLDNASMQGDHVMKRLEEFRQTSRIVGDVRGRGLMIGIELVEDKETRKPAPKKASEVMLRSWKRGVTVVTCGVSTLRIVPPLTIQTDLLDSALDILEDTINEVTKET
jgi:4-aminobutyrate aminotransferase